MDPITPLVGIALAAAFCEKVVEKLRDQFPIIRGPVTNLVAYALGIALAFGFNIAVFADLGFTGADWLDHIFTGFGLGAGSGFLADWSGRSGPRAA